jgi:hypothetical protein
LPQLEHVALNISRCPRPLEPYPPPYEEELYPPYDDPLSRCDLRAARQSAQRDGSENPRLA